MNNILLEIGTEEIPARFMSDLLEDFKKEATSQLSSFRISYDELEVLGTDRRLALIINGVAKKQTDYSQKIKGPPQKAPKEATIGFCKKNNIKKDNLILEDSYYYALINHQGLPTKTILKDLFINIIKNLHLPIAMKWGKEDFSFIRPIHWIVSLYNDELIPFEIANIKSDIFSQGHRFLTSKKENKNIYSNQIGKNIKITSPQEYKQIMMDNFVIVDPKKRKQKIHSQLEQNKPTPSESAIISKNLLEEVNFINEWPMVLSANFEKKYLKLPKEILILTMQKNQKYFPLEDNKGNLSSNFMIVTNNHTNKKNVINGNERVLTARLEDARFFYEEDLKQELSSRVEDLKKIVYQEKIGTLYEKIQRVEAIAFWMKNNLTPNIKINQQHLKEAIWLSKTDIVTNIVYEFPELQGIMGRIYAQKEKKAQEVSEAIFEHYLPRFAEDTLPKTNIGTIVSISDKIDTICSCFAAGLIPSGSQDPYALRRSALGIIRILLDKNWQIPINDIIEQNSNKLTNSQKEQILEFFRQRLKFVLANNIQTSYTQKLDQDVIETILPITEVNKALQLALIYQKNKNKDSFIKTVQSAIRIHRLAKNTKIANTISPSLFKDDIEKNFWTLYNTTINKINVLEKKNDYQNIFDTLLAINPEIEKYFEKILVMDKDEKIKNNRLSMLKKWQQIFWQYGDWEKIVY